MSNPVRIFCTLIAGVCLAAGVLAEDHSVPATIDAKELNFDKAANMAYGKGDVVVRYKDTTLRADLYYFNIR